MMYSLKRRMANLPKLRFLGDCKTDVSAHSSGYQPVIVSYRLSYRQSLWNRFTCGFLVGKKHEKNMLHSHDLQPFWSRWYRFLRQHHLKCLLIPSSPTNGNNDASKVGSSWSFGVGATKKATCHREFADISWVALALAYSCSCFLLLCSDILFFLLPSDFFLWVVVLKINK